MESTSWTVAPVTDPSAIDGLFEHIESIFGPRPDATSRFRTWVESPDWYVLEARQGDECVGACVARRASLQMIKQHRTYTPELDQYLDTEDPKALVGSFQIISVTPKYRQQGLAEALARTTLEWMQDSGCVGLIGFCWEHSSAASSRHLFEKAGFTRLHTVENFYRDTNPTGQHCCAVCEGLCHCSATLYVRQGMPSR